MQHTDIAIIGAGMVGASLVHLLKPALAQGCSISLIERHELRWDGDFATRPPSFDGRATAISYGSQQILHKLGLWQAMAERACPIHHIQVSDQGHLGQTQLHAADQDCEALGYIVENAVIGQGLLAGLAQPGVQIHAPAQVLNVQMNEQGARLTLDNGDTLQARLLVLADGARSNLAAELGIDHHTEHYGTHALVTQIRTNQAHQHWAFERFTQYGPLALLPLNAQDFVVVWALPDDEIDAVCALPDAEFLLHLHQQIGQRIGTLVEVGPRSRYPLALVQAKEQVRRSLVLLGNAAHSLHPVAGQGFNLALRDAAALAEALNQAAAAQQNLGELATLLAYQQRQATDQRNTILASDCLPKLFGAQDKRLIMLRNLGLMGLSLSPTSRRLFARHAMGLGLRAAHIG